VLAAATALAEPVHSIALAGVTGGDGFDERALATVEELVLAALDNTGRVRVVGRTEIAQRIGWERARRLATCADAACAAELAGRAGRRRRSRWPRSRARASPSY